MAVTAAAQASIIYSIDRNVGDGTVTGFIETDGTLGNVGVSNLLDWSVTVQAPNINGGNPTTASRAGGQSFQFSLGGFLIATATDLLFDFTGGMGVISIFTETGDFWCLAQSAANWCFLPNAEVIGYDEVTSREGHVVAYQGVHSIASVAINAVAEPGSLALILLAGAIAVRLPRKRRLGRDTTA